MISQSLQLRGVLGGSIKDVARLKFWDKGLFFISAHNY